MKDFVNREAELSLIDDAFGALLDRKRLLRTPIIEFYGVGGIGKTSILKKVKQRCTESQLPYIWIDISKNATNFSNEILSQIEKYNIQLSSKERETGALERSIYATRSLLKQGPVVMLLDSVDTADPELLSHIESMLRDLIDDENFFVILASKRDLAFQQERSVARKLKALPLNLLDRSSCNEYLDHLDKPLDPEIRNLIFEWTRGYPLAMNVMAQAVSTGLDPREDTDQKQILVQIKERVINQQILATIDAKKRVWFLSALELLSIPRRFNLVIMQDLIETFAPELKRESSLAYFSLPKEIHEATGVLSWRLSRAGFSVDAPVRNIFVLLLKLERPEQYFAIHTYLAEMNLRLAGEVTGSDRIRYLREYLYHTACNTAVTSLPEQLQQAMQTITNDTPESFLQFSEEFSQDEELKEVLGAHLGAVQSAIHHSLATLNQQMAKESSGADRVRFWQAYFSHLLHNPSIPNLSDILRQNIQDVIKDEKPEIAYQLYKELAREDKFKEQLGQDYERYASLIRKNFEAEG